MTVALAEALRRLLGAFERHQIRYMICGSAASGLYGHVRMTGDVDIVAAVGPEDIAPLVEELRSEFYIDADQIRWALEQGRSFNLVHLQSSFKFDIFPLTSDRYEQVQFERRRYAESSLPGAGQIQLAFAAPEDVILSKLRWYRQGGEVSELQWNDVLGVIAVQGDRLDLEHLHEWALYLHVADLLEQALAERHEPRP